MNTHNENGEIPILSDAVSYVSQHPEMYLKQDVARQEELLIRMISTLVCTQMLPIRIYRRARWSCIAAETDWVLHAKMPSIDALFRRLNPMPEGGVFAFRAEVLLTAFAERVVTWTLSEVTWIKGRRDTELLPEGFCLEDAGSNGRVIAFTVELFQEG